MEHVKMDTFKTDESKAIFKIVFVGNQGVGKTALIKKISSDEYSDTKAQTIGVDFIMAPVQTSDNTKVTVQLWDTAGDVRYRQIVNIYYKRASAVVMCFDVTDRGSFEDLAIWYENIQKVGGDVKLFILGLKLDLDRVVSIEDCRNFADRIGATYIAASAKLQHSDELKQQILTKICDMIKHDNYFSSENDESTYQSDTTDENDQIALIEKEPVKNKFACCTIL